LPNKGADAVDFLVQKFSIFGFDGQYWMLAGAVVVAVFIVFVWRTRDRT
jgi:putative solute:sodium symporter small subunit